MLLLQIAFFSAAGGFLYGYDLALISGALSEIRDHFNLSEALEEAIVGAAKIGAFFGTFLGGALMLHYGRRMAIALNSVFYALGPLIMAFAPNASILLLGRLLVGLGIGLSAVVTPAYLGEISPAHLRGRIVESYEILLCIGMLMSSGMDVALGSNWRWMVGLPGILGLALSAALFILPESPRWLVVNNRLDEALIVIRKVYMSAGLANEDVEQELMELWSNVEKEKAAHQELLARRLARQSSHPGGSAVGVLGTHGPIATAPIASTGLAHETELLNGVRGGAARGGCAAGLLGIKGQTADALKISIESAYEAVPLRDVSADTAAAAGEVSTHLHGTSCEEIHAAQPAPQLRSAQLAGHGMGMSHSRSSSGAEDVEQPHIRGNDVESHRLESRHDPVKGSPDVHALGSRSKRPRLHHSKGTEDTRALLEAQNLSDGQSRSETDKGSVEPRLYQELSSIPQGLSPIRTQTWSDQSSRSQNGSPRKHQMLHFYQQLDLEGFWKAQKQVILDIWTVLHGEERKAVRMALWIALIDQAMGSTAVVNYAPQLLERAGVANHTLATAWSSCISASKFLGVLVSLWCVDSSGRRPLMVWGGVGCSTSLLLLTVGDAQRSVPLILFAMCTFLFAFSASYAAVFWVLCAELFSMAVKAPASSAAMAVLFASGAVANLVFLTLHTWLHSAAFLVFAAIAGCGTLYVYLSLPETKGISLAAIQVLLQEEGLRVEKPDARSEGVDAAFQSGGRWERIKSAVQDRLSLLSNRHSRFTSIES